MCKGQWVNARARNIIPFGCVSLFPTALWVYSHKSIIIALASSVDYEVVFQSRYLKRLSKLSRSYLILHRHRRSDSARVSWIVWTLFCMLLLTSGDTGSTKKKCSPNHLLRTKINVAICLAIAQLDNPASNATNPTTNNRQIGRFRWQRRMVFCSQLRHRSRATRPTIITRGAVRVHKTQRDCSNHARGFRVRITTVANLSVSVSSTVNIVSTWYANNVFALSNHNTFYWWMWL